jgi:hypothetical protein
MTAHHIQHLIAEALAATGCRDTSIRIAAALGEVPVAEVRRIAGAA